MLQPYLSEITRNIENDYGVIFVPKNSHLYAKVSNNAVFSDS